MSELKATPGPYTVSERISSYGAEAAVWGPDGDLLAAVWDNLALGGTALENAHLLAASWDLYEALEQLMKFVNRPYSYKERVAAFTRARAALAKARGEQ